MSIQIQKGVPIPPKKTNPSELRVALTTMAVGDSFIREKAPAGPYLYRGDGFKYAVRKVEGGFRVWRVA